MVRKLLAGTLVTVLFALAACGGTNANSGPQSAVTVQMNTSDFVQTGTVNLKTGGTITFQGLAGANGGTHALATGQNATYEPEPGAPADLENANGVTVTAGQSVTYTFATAGTYHIACLIHPAMNLTVKVTG